jgi:DNA phosphorothioation-dependent restriction protein DptG
MWGSFSGFLKTKEYIIEITGSMEGFNTYIYSMTLTLSVKGICDDDLTAPPVYLNSDWSTCIGDS